MALEDRCCNNRQHPLGNSWLDRLVGSRLERWSATRRGFGAAFMACLGLLVPVFYGLLWVIYSVVLESSASAATLGKRVMGLKVQMLDGSKAPSNKVLMRNLSKIFWIIFLIDFLIGIATPGPDPRQRYFDRIAGTTVVSVKQVFTAAAPPPPPPPPPP